LFTDAFPVPGAQLAAQWTTESIFSLLSQLYKLSALGKLILIYGRLTYTFPYCAHAILWPLDACSLSVHLV
jgi:hypothetical protein